MKRSLSLLSVLAFVLAFSGSAFAQPDISASADIVADLTFSKNSDLSYGQLSTNQTADAILDPNGTDSDVGSTTSYGELEITGSPSASIVITFDSNPDLSDGTNTIGFTPDHSGNTTQDASGSSDLNSTGSNTVSTNGSGKYWVFYGGTLSGTDIGSVPTGSYTSTIQTTINYE